MKRFTKVRYLPVYLLTIALFACGSSSKLSLSDNLTYDDINNLTQDKKSIIILKNEKSLYGKRVFMTLDSTSWYDIKTDKKQSTPTSKIKKIIVPNPTRGGQTGALWGALLGGSVGLIAGLTMSNSNEDSSTPDFGLPSDSDIKTGLYVGAGFLIGGITGAIVGSINARDEIQITDDPGKK